MTEAQRLAHPELPGVRVRASLIQRGIDAERERLLAFLLEKGIIRESMCGDGFVAVAEYLPEGESTLDWKAIDLPKDLNAWEPKGKR